MEATQPIPAQPLPTNWHFDHTPGGEAVVMVINNPQGTAVHFMAADIVDEICKQMRKQARQCWNIQQNPGAGIVVPGTPLLAPNGTPIKVIDREDPRDIEPPAFGPDVPPSEEGKRHLESIDNGEPQPEDPTDG